MKKDKFDTISGPSVWTPCTKGPDSTVPLTFEEYPGITVRPEVITNDFIISAAPFMAKHPKLLKRIMHLLRMDEVNAVHSRWCATPGPEFAHHLIKDDFQMQMIVDGTEVFDSIKTGPFITVSNHPFGSLDGIALIDIVTQYRSDYKVMVNMFLNKITAMRPNFIAVDPMAQNDPEKRKVSVQGIRLALQQLKEGHGMGFFPAGAMSKTDRHGFLQDREWQPSVLQIIQKAKVPVIPIYFHGNNHRFFNFLGHACWQLRSALLARELFKKRGHTMHVSIGNPISVEKQAEFGKDYTALGQYLRQQTYALHSRPAK